MNNEINMYIILNLILSITGIIILYVKTNGRITRLETQIEIFWKGVSFDAATILHKPHRDFQRRDELLDKYIDGTINNAEHNELCEMLKDIINNGEQTEKQSASILWNVMKAKHNIVKEVERILKN